jgi:hypothetical protein
MVMDPALLGALSDYTADYRLALSSERAPHFNNEAIVRPKKRKEKSGHEPQRRA